MLACEITGELTRGVGALAACSGVLSAVKATRGAAFIVCVVVVPGVYRGSIARSVGVTSCSCACPRSHLTCVATRWSAVRKAHTQHPDARCLRRVLDAATDPRPVFVSAPHNAGAVPMLLDGCVAPLDVRYEVPCLPSVCCACTVLCCAGWSHVDRLRAQRARVVIPIPATTDTLLGRSDDADCRFRQAVVDFVSQVLQEQRPTAVRMARWFWIPFKITPVQAYAAIERGVELYFKSALLLCRSYTLPAASSPGRCGVLQQRLCEWGNARPWSYLTWKAVTLTPSCHFRTKKLPDKAGSWQPHRTAQMAWLERPLPTSDHDWWIWTRQSPMTSGRVEALAAASPGLDPSC